jgi:hypothetical protein
MGADEYGLGQLGKKSHRVLPRRTGCELLTALDLDPVPPGKPRDRLHAASVRTRHDPVDRVCRQRGRQRPRVRSSDAIELASAILFG